jgi:DNA repair exonuclease SbcCD ATPase subunit
MTNKIEKLTDEESERLARMYQTPLGRKALTERAVLVAVIERVRAIADECESCTGYDASETVRIFRGIARRLRDALAGAGAQEADVAVILARVHRDVIDKQASDLSAANARIAELEAWYTRAMKDVSELNKREHAANARAEAAERRVKELCALHLATTSEQRDEIERAESERDEWKAKCEAAERARDELDENYQVRRDAHERAESEVAQWKERANQQEQHAIDNDRARADEHNERIAAQSEAKALRAELADQIKLANGALDAQAEAEKKWFAARSEVEFLTNAPAAPTRTDLERAVLDAMRNIRMAVVEKRAQCLDPVGMAFRAELARREAGGSSTRIHDAERAVLGIVRQCCQGSRTWMQANMSDLFTADEALRNAESYK